MSAESLYLFEDRVVLARPIEEVFAFFSQAKNLERITPAFLRFEVLTPEPLEMREGLKIDYRLRVRGIPLRWQSEITEWNPPFAFTDEQRRGPYKTWIHRHAFSSTPEGHTQMCDRVRYAVFGGALVNRLFVRPDVERIFAHRRSCMREFFGEVR